MRWRKPPKEKGQEWPDYGLCDNPVVEAENRFLYVDPSLSNREFVETVIHEAMHAELWCLDEESVTRVAENITRLLDKCGMIPPEPD